MKDDKTLERERYDAKAKAQTQAGWGRDLLIDWYQFVPEIYREPYEWYVAKIRSCVSSESRVLEIGCGMGAFTGVLLRSAATVCATDISPSSLEVLRARYNASGNLETKVTDMESLPFQDGSFDVVASAGSLSYGDSQLVMNEIHRVLRPGGYFVCVDSFNHNPIYRLNRWLHYLKGDRTISTLMRMPSMSTLDRYAEKFSKIDVWYFGSISWMIGGLQKMFGTDVAVRLSKLTDRAIGVKRSAFKIVMISTK
jgi:ubiquinone/menaquinone biosynthesis C-methylase UbiE